VRVLDDAGNEVARGVQGNIVLQLPLAPGGVQELWQSPVRFEKSYISRFPGFYDTSDAGLFDEQGYLSVMARTDDVMNIAGHRLSSGQLEEVLSSHPSIAECAAIAVPDELRGHVPVGIVVLKSGLGGQGANAADGNEKQAASDPKVIEAECVAAVRARVGAVACFKRVIVVPRLPKTRSGKLLRNVLRAMAAGEQNIPVPPTIEDASVLEEVQAHMRKQGIGILQSKN
jgi:propionyl-CoA synthetase